MHPHMPVALLWPLRLQNLSRPQPEARRIVHAWLGSSMERFAIALSSARCNSGVACFVALLPRAQLHLSKLPH